MDADQARAGAVSKQYSGDVPKFFLPDNVLVLIGPGFMSGGGDKKTGK
ncbi:hypothetical protein [Pseudomonas libanensis]|nr:hypothetical protein [Pseudomonas libanensis]